MHLWTQEKLAELLHVNKRTVQRWEAGDRHCPDLVLMLVERLVKENGKTVEESDG